MSSTTQNLNNDHIDNIKSNTGIMKHTCMLTNTGIIVIMSEFGCRIDLIVVYQQKGVQIRMWFKY